MQDVGNTETRGRKALSGSTFGGSVGADGSNKRAPEPSNAVPCWALPNILTKNPGETRKASPLEGPGRCLVSRSPEAPP